MITKSDIAVILILIVLSVSSFVFAFRFKQDGNRIANIYSDGKLYASYELENLSEPVNLKVINKFGVLDAFISKEKCCIKNSDCLDKQCLKQYEITDVNQIITCLPNRIIIEIVCKKADDVDMVAY